MKILRIIADALWLVVRWYKRKDANEPQRELDKARDASARGDDADLNRRLRDAADRMHKPHRE